VKFSWSFRKSKKIAKGVRLNAGKRGGSVRVGGRHAGVSIGKRGVHPSISFFGFRIRL